MTSYSAAVALVDETIDHHLRAEPGLLELYRRHPDTHLAVTTMRQVMVGLVQSADRVGIGWATTTLLLSDMLRDQIGAGHVAFARMHQEQLARDLAELRERPPSVRLGDPYGGTSHFNQRRPGDPHPTIAP